MHPQFERFMAGPWKRHRGRMHVTINHKGDISMNRKAHELFGSPTAVALGYDRINSVIAVENAYAKLPEAFSLHDKHGTKVIHAAPFCRQFGIRLDRTMKFDEAEVLPDGTLRLDLRKMSPAGLKVYKPRVGRPVE